MNSRLLIVDDKASFRTMLEKLLGADYDLTSASTGDEALALVSTGGFDLVLSDVRMPGADGFELLRAVKRASPLTEVVLMTGFASVDSAVRAMREGAYDYLQKPFEPEKAMLVIQRALERRTLKAEAMRLREVVDGAAGFGALVGNSPAMAEAIRLLKRAAAIDLNVLVTGESGTGKELAARAIHLASSRRAGPFVAINCGALPAEIVESELFGHAKGAFTGAAAARRGLVEEAGGGTLFLDEIGDLPLPAQVKLNRVIQERELRRVGETRAIPVDLRIVAATHVDLKAAAARGAFREDLFYRLNVFAVRLPPLRERTGDVALLAMRLLQRASERHGRAVPVLSPAALRMLETHSWPGNVRELENAMERALGVAEGEDLLPDHLPPELVPSPDAQPPDLSRMTYREALVRAREVGSREYLASLMRAFGGNVTRAAERAGVERESLHRLLKRFGVRRGGDDDPS